MQYKEFIGQVQHRAKLATEGDAVKAVRTTLNTLSERLFGNEAEHLASQLPEEIGVFIQKNDSGEKFSLDEFFTKVSEKEGTKIPEAVFHSRAVIDVLKDAVSPGEIEHISAQLPPDYNRLFEAGSTGRMPKQ